MLSQSIFLRDLVTECCGMLYETGRSKGMPMMLFDEIHGNPIASILFESRPVPLEKYGKERIRFGDIPICPSVIFQRDLSLFQAMTCMDETLISFVITNMLFDGDIAVNITHFGTDELVNDINVFEPGVSQRITGDASKGNHIYVLNKDESNAPSHLHPPGIYFNVRVFPMQKGRSFEKAKWKCTDMFCRPRKFYLDNDAAAASPSMEEELIVYEAGGTESIDFFLSVGSIAKAIDQPDVEILTKAFSVTQDFVLNHSGMFLKSLARGDALKEETCVICLDGAPDTIFVPCSHCVAHKKCQEASKTYTCPVCRAFVYALLEKKK